MKQFSYTLITFFAFWTSVVFSQTTTENYVLSRTYQNAGMTELNGANFSGSPTSVQTQLVYLDGLGKTKLAVAAYSSPSQKDILVQTQYDAIFRPSKSFLPVASSTGDGTFRATIDGSYYNGTSVCVPTPNNFTQTNYESSPLNRANEQLAPGIFLGVRQQFLTNSATDLVFFYQIQSDNVTLNPNPSYYPANTLNIIRTLDEDSKTTLEFRDRYNRVVLKRVDMGNAVYLDTYYVYNQKKELRFVLQPQYQQEANLDKFAFQYTYDAQGRMLTKHIPGTVGVSTMAYDIQDRLIQSTDAKAQSFFYVYDALNRPSITKYSLSGVQKNVSETYYDNYTNFAPFQVFNNELSLTATDFVPNGLNNTACKGLVTVSRTRLFDPNGTLLLDSGGGEVWLQTVTYYDSKYRVIQIIRQMFGLGVSAFERVSYKLDFTGKIKTERTTQSTSVGINIIEKNYAYDHMDRLLSIQHKIYTGDLANNPALNPIKTYTHVTNTYNEIGQMSLKSLHDGIQNLTYKYTARGWLCGITNSGGQTFNIGLGYNNNGNIATMNWATASGFSSSFSSISYDGANRLKDASGTIYSEANITYDKNGNILTLLRANNGTTIDNLLYNEAGFGYDGNLLKRVRDATGNSPGFTDNNNATNDYAYDNNGSLTQDLNKGITSIAYNAMNLTRQVVSNGQTVSYTFDAMGNKRQTLAPNSSSTIYEGAFEYLNGVLQRIGVEEGQLLRASNGVFTANYYLKDHLGNVRQVISEAGVTLQETDYYPFGMAVTRTGAANNKYLYNGKETQPQSNWLDYGARMYNPEIARWMTPDPMAESREWVSPYNYVQNNPILRIDPNGALDENGALEEPWYKKAANWISNTFSNSDASRTTQSVVASTSYTLVQSQEVRKEYVGKVAGLDKTDSQGRTQAKMEAREKTPAIMREVAEQMRPSSGESTRVGGTASKTNVGVNKMVGTLGTIGKVAGVASVGISVYNVATSENKPQAIATEGGALVGAIAGGEVGAEVGAAIGVWFGGVGAVPGAIIGGVAGSIGGGIIGAKAGTTTYNTVTTKKEEKK